MRRYLLSLAGAMLATTALPGAASAQNAIVDTELNMRAGPSTSFPVVDVIPDNAPVRVHGCVHQYQWCDVTFRDSRGWVHANYLRYQYSGRYVPIIEYGPRIDVPIIAFSVGTYWDSYYRDRPWYSRRAYWRQTWRGDRDDRADRRPDPRQDRADRPDRREGRAERREDVNEQRAEGKREPRQEKRSERREQRGERRGDRREAQTEQRQEQRAKRAEGRPESRGTISRGMEGNRAPDRAESNRGPGRVEGNRGPGRGGPEGGRGGGGRDANPGRGG